MLHLIIVPFDDQSASHVLKIIPLTVVPRGVSSIPRRNIRISRPKSTAILELIREPGVWETENLFTLCPDIILAPQFVIYGGLGRKVDIGNSSWQQPFITQGSVCSIRKLP